MTRPETARIVHETVFAGGQRIAYQQAGPVDGPVVLLLHGLASDSATWDKAIAPLAERGLRVFALDLIGHGRSAKPVGPYLLDDFAESLEAFMVALDLPAATLCGHSLGGAVAVHFGFRFPRRVQRLVLVSAGGLGREVHLLLRAAALPVAPRVLDAALRPALLRFYARPRLHRALRLTPDNLVNLRRAGRALGTAEGRSSFFAALRGVIEPGGQRGSFIEMQTLADHVPTMLVWAEHDPVIPVAHARAAHAHLPSSRLVVFPGASHEPHRRDAPRFAAEVADFIASS
ncbi:alpha/beta fold hydrolase [uncultured Jatrophihabitans sp.]|uniref:alpha/beta fold hydrolase n=1 Tax=uncultured Jatrophihabitans sp. TaxID=1610747 RepID=UPI0035CC0ED8